MLSSLALTLSGNPMASNSPDPARRPDPALRPVRSFRVERSVSPDPKTRPKRASTIENGPPSSTLSLRTASGTIVAHASASETPDASVSRISEEATEPPRVSVDLDDLPIELISLTDRFIDTLSAKVHPTPPSIDNLSAMFQNFYATASSHIQTHVDTLATRQRREDASPSLSTRSSAASLLRAKASGLSSKEKPKATPLRRDSDQQLLTPEEQAERKRARKALEQKKSMLEEAVERRLCEGIYSKIYRHRSTQDEAQDAKLRSKTAALSVVGIGPADLGVELGNADADPEAAAKKQDEVKEWLEQARKDLVRMSQSRYPLGKLNHLKAAHKSIIDTLSHFHPSSSADELMPMLIYTLITLPPENLNVISDVNFIQRFRWEPKLVGEAAYCLTTLEATISFLDTVDLSTLRADETPTGPLKTAAASPAPKGDTFPPAFSPTLSPNPSAPSPKHPQPQQTPQSPSPAGFRATVNAQLRGPRRLSDLVRNTPTPAQALNAASDAVLTTADQSLKTIGTSLGDSYKFLLGKLREPATSRERELVVPKTLEEARKLIGSTAPSPPPPKHVDEEGVPELALRSPSPSPEDTERPPLLSFISGTGGRRAAGRDRSADSARSASSAGTTTARRGEERRISESVGGVSGSGTVAVATGSPVAPTPPIMDSMRNLGSSLNPMARLSAGIGGFRGFGRSSVTAAPVMKEGGDLATAFPDLPASLPPRETPHIAPPVKRFLELQNAADLKLGEVFDLLKEYKRLAGALREMGAFKE
ncbi:hypothetical protein C8A05DRAFT_33633 [Staphylotrichum tortipilum]|uniref:VPS9 domain-containing protein n=1 Tax=Staphylotrichum tortipilum TaxID=2831512 RepID=A0AAN6MMH2_9PEZI|nr:hypothetical protein C8A05DRAFT_33633 [Staphylotrichum longicolle]